RTVFWCRTARSRRLERTFSRSKLEDGAFSADEYIAHLAIRHSTGNPDKDAKEGKQTWLVFTSSRLIILLSEKDGRAKPEAYVARSPTSIFAVTPTQNGVDIDAEMFNASSVVGAMELFGMAKAKRRKITIPMTDGPARQLLCRTFARWMPVAKDSSAP
ncbi:hypothetical protein CAOG_09191, partial [Capsaspora owczarzaki ATCC 30864]|uniref:hypothetical protein n=1 Tax=Capsaspora owczarzaki (strain ATCC 30864) TaxID=595528 RepID=UPI00035207F2